MKEGWSKQKPATIKQMNKYHYYEKLIAPAYYSHISLCGMFFLKRLKKDFALDIEKCKRCQKSLERRSK
jgi:hypothetical protein